MLLKNGFIILIMWMVISCRSPSNEKYFWVTTANNKSIDTVPIDKIIIDSLPSGSKSIYYIGKDSIFYFLRPDTLYGSQTNRFSGINGELILFADTSIVLQNDTLHVYTYIQNEEVEDGAVIHYWEKHIGVFAVHSVAWPGLTILQSNDSIKNSKIRLMIKVCVPEFFLRNK